MLRAIVLDCLGGGFRELVFFFVTPSEPEEKGSDAEEERGVNVAKAMAGALGRSGEAGTGRVTGNEDELNDGADRGFFKVTFFDFDFEDLHFSPGDLGGDIGHEAEGVVGVTSWFFVAAHDPFPEEASL